MDNSSNGRFTFHKKYFNPKSRPKTQDVTLTSQFSFSDFGLSRELLKAIYSAGFLYPSPIQKETIPVILDGKQVLARAKNGTGKTAAYAIPSVQKICPAIQAIQVLVIVPSRELALQTHQVFKKLSLHCNVRMSLCIGGTSISSDLDSLEGAHIMIGTPGRIQHVLRVNSDALSQCRMVVVDEADVLLEDHFLLSIEHIVSATFEKRQILLFSATFPLTVKKFSDKWMANAEKINTMEELTLKGVTPFYVHLDESQKLNCLWYLLNKLNINQSIIFVSTVSRAELLFAKMCEKGYSCECIHSKMEQTDRSKIYEDFRKGGCRHLIATNLFTRGIDISTVNVVINFDFPKTAETYLHRCGRSGRFGQVGLSIELVTEEDLDDFYATEEYLGIRIAKMPEEIDLAIYN